MIQIIVKLQINRGKEKILKASGDKDVRNK